jgi:hypothetical protein
MRSRPLARDWHVVTAAVGAFALAALDVTGRLLVAVRYRLTNRRLPR